MRSKMILTSLTIILIAGAVFLFSKEKPETTSNDTAKDTGNKAQFAFDNPKKSAHYENNTPEHGAILAAPPVRVVINFNFDLAEPSAISITKNGQEYGAGDLLIDGNKLSMRRDFARSAPDGLYKVTYKACWPDRSCHNGHFEFAVDRTRSASYEDMTGKAEVTIKMSEIMFKPQNLKISSGTKITWVNDEAVEHYVNTDSHPAHTYHPAQNSTALKQNETYALIFDMPGIYPYHCSAHADIMTGKIVVLDD